MRIGSWPVSLLGRSLGGLLVVVALIGTALMLLVVGDAISVGVAPGAELRLAPFRWEPKSGLA
jgi:hypothetical protein